MPVRIVEGQLPYTGGTGIEIDANKVISLLLREENNLILVNDDNEIYTDLQLASGLTPQSDFPVGVTTGKVLEADGRPQSGLMLNWKTTSGDYARWIYCADGEIYFDGGNGVWRKVYYSSEVDALLQQLRNYIDLNFQPKLTAGAGITIDANNVISAQGAGTGDVSGPNSSTNEDIVLFDGTTGKAIKDSGVKLSSLQEKLTAGTNIQINGNTINATDTTYTAGTNIQISAQNVISATGGSDIVYATQAEYNALLPGAASDGKHYFIYTSSKLPSAYQEVEWIETSGSQYINTGIVPTNMTTELKFEVTSTAQDLKLFGTDLLSSAGDYYHLTPYSNSWYFGVNGGEGHGGTYSNVVGTQYVVVFNDSNDDLVVNDIIQTSCAGTTSTAQIQIAKRGNDGGMGKYKYFYFNLYNKTTSEYVMKLVPCYRKSDSVIGMYDLISDTFFTNAGSGTFTKGPDV